MLLTTLLALPVLLQQEPPPDPAVVAYTKVIQQYQKAQALHLSGTMEIFIPPMDEEEAEPNGEAPALLSMGTIDLSARLARPALGNFKMKGELNFKGQSMPIHMEMIGSKDGLFSLDHDEETYLELDGIGDPEGPALAMSEVDPLGAWFGNSLEQKAKPVLLDASKAPKGDLGFRFADKERKREFWIDAKGRLLRATVVLMDGKEVMQRMEFRFTECETLAKVDAATYARAIPEGYALREENYDFGEAEDMPDFEGSLLAVGAAAPAVKMTDMSGEEVSMASLKGKTVLLNFWFYH